MYNLKPDRIFTVYTVSVCYSPLSLTTRMDLAVLFRGRSVLVPEDSLGRVDPDVVDQIDLSWEPYRDPVDALECQVRLGLITLPVTIYTIVTTRTCSEIIKIERTHWIISIFEFMLSCCCAIVPKTNVESAESTKLHFMSLLPFRTSHMAPISIVWFYCCNGYCTVYSTYCTCLSYRKLTIDVNKS